MLKINLLPVKAARRSQMGKRQLLLFVVIVLATLGTLVLLHVKYVKQDTGDLSKKLSDLQKKTKQIEAKTGDVSRYEKSKRKYKKRRKAYNQVLGGCFCRCSGAKKLVDCTTKCESTQKMLRFCPGPVLVMRELSRVLSERWGPTLKDALNNSRRMDYYNPNWDPTSLWITTWQEEAGVLRMMGGAKANDDIAEFEKRLQVSRYFADVSVIKTALVTGKEEKLNHYQFELTARVKY